MYPQETEGHDLRDYLGLLRRRGWILLLCVIVLPIAVYKYTETFPKKFQASTTLQVQAAGDQSLPNFSGQSSNNQAIASYVGTTAVADEAARQLRLPKGSLYGVASATADQDTGFITITATGPTARRATATANAFAAALNATRGKAGLATVDAAIQRAQQQLAKTPKSDLTTQSQLRNQIAQLQTL